MQISKTIILGEILAAVSIYTVAGFLSSYLFFMSEIHFLPNALFPGLVFIGASLLVFVVAKIELKATNMLRYILLMYLTYLAVFFITFYSTTFGFLTGIITTAMGSYITFDLTNRFITRLNFDAQIVFFLGGFSFILNDLLMFPGISEAIKPFYLMRDDVSSMFALSYLFWQLIVGTKLLVTLQNSRA